MTALSTPEKLRTRLDALLGRATMYRLVTIILGTLAVVAVFLAAIDELFFDPLSMIVALAVLLAASVGASIGCGLLWKVTPHRESAVITGLLLWFLYWPSPTGEDLDLSHLVWLAVAAALANLSKYVLAFRGRHLFNPAAAGAALMVLIGEVVDDVPATSWWAASESLSWFVLIGAGLVLYRTGRIDMAVPFVVVAAVLTYIGVDEFYGVGGGIEYVLYSTPILFFVGFMLSEPLTLPPRRAQQMWLAVVAAVLFAWPLITGRIFDEPVKLGPFEGTYELALLVVNAIAFFLGQRGGVRLDVREVRRLGRDVWEVEFEPEREVRFTPGQYLELHLPHDAADVRGTRRAFSISSAPHHGNVTVAVRASEPMSSFKQALLELEPGTVVTATSVQGDFVWPANVRPLVLVAGGIGVTPFLSQLRSGALHDVVLVYGVPDADHVPYRDELVGTGARVVLVAPSAPASLPDGWGFVEGAVISADAVAAAVPDLRDRLAYVSGPPAMVDTVRAGLRGKAAGIKIDAFTGY